MNFVRRAVPLFAACLCLLLGTTASAEAPAGGIVPMLSGSDGSVRTLTGVRLSMTPAGVGDHVAAMSGPVQTRMGAIRACFGDAMERSPEVAGRVVFDLETLPRGRARTRTSRDETGNAGMVDCMRRALNETPLASVREGARASIMLELSNPAAQVRQRLEANQARVKVRVSAGRAESEGATQQGEVHFRISGDAGEREAIAELHRDVSARFAGLLDCRRKASRRNRPAEGTITLDLKLERGRIERAQHRAQGLVDRSAPGCIIKWLERADRAHLVPSELVLAITFAK